MWSQNVAVTNVSFTLTAGDKSDMKHSTHVQLLKYIIKGRTERKLKSSSMRESDITAWRNRCVALPRNEASHSCIQSYALRGYWSSRVVHWSKLVAGMNCCRKLREVRTIYSLAKALCNYTNKGAEPPNGMGKKLSILV